MSWRFWKRRRASGLTEEQRAALKSLVADARYELIPLSNALERAAALPPGSQVTVTASPSHGIEATFDLAEAVAAMGHDVTPISLRTCSATGRTWPTCLSGLG